MLQPCVAEPVLTSVTRLMLCASAVSTVIVRPIVEPVGAAAMLGRAATAPPAT